MEFRDLKRQYEYLKPQIDEQIAEVISSAHFISGKQVKELETTLAEYVGVKHCISCANGTDAINIALLAYGIGVGDAVFVPDFTFFSSGECPAIVGATPIFVDVLATTYNINPDSLVSAIEKVLAESDLKPRAVLAVDLFGQPFDYEAIRDICEKYDLLILEDAAQGFGGSYTTVAGNKKMACSLGNIATTSFFPAKPLGCYGDGGAIFTNNDDIASLCRSIAVHGKDMKYLDDTNAKYNNVRLGMNSRLDTLQAGILLAKFPVFCDEELYTINKIASLYSEQLKDTPGVVIPTIEEKYYSSWAQYTIRLSRFVDRSLVQQRLKEDGIPSNIYYMKPMHKQEAFYKTRSAVADCPVTEELCRTVLCLPIHPYLAEEEVNFVVSRLKTLLIK